MKESIKVAKEFYETFEGLKYNEGFVKFRDEVVYPRIESLEEEILNHAVTTDEDVKCLVSDILLHKKLLTIFCTFFDVAEDQAKLLRKTVKQREKKRELDPV